MYVPRYYRPNDEAELIAFARANPFALLVSSDAEGVPTATHIPFHFIDDQTLFGHVAKANPHWKLLREKPQVLIVFGGPHAYVSPSWYDHENVPTWNYIAVHVRGEALLLTTAEELRPMVDMQVAVHEPIGGYALEKLDPKFVVAELKGIVGIRVPVSRIEGTFKLSQNRDAKNFDVVKEKLASDPATREVAEWMGKKSPHRK